MGRSRGAGRAASKGLREQRGLSGHGRKRGQGIRGRWLPAWTGNQPERLAAFYTEDAYYSDPAIQGMNLPFKTCPQCGVEHVATALVCADCNVALEVLPTGGAEPPATASLPPASELTRIAAGGPWEMERLALQLQEAGISSRIDAMPSSAPSSRPVGGAPPRGSSGSGARLALYVLPAQEKLARGVIQSILVEDGSGGAARAGEGEALDACPACGAAISPIASACAECGLEFVPIEDLCSSCGAILAAEATVCPTCGAEQRREGAD